VAKTRCLRWRAGAMPTTPTARAPTHPRAHHHAPAQRRAAPRPEDQDSLPPTRCWTPSCPLHGKRRAHRDIVAAGFARPMWSGHAPDQDQRVQAPPGAGGHPRHARSFGKDWRYPITNKFRA
jgi:hypothetical protein